MTIKKEINRYGKETGNIYYYANDGVLLAEFCPAHTGTGGREYQPTVYFLTRRVLTLEFNRSYFERFKPKYKAECLEIISRHSQALLSEMDIF